MSAVRNRSSSVQPTPTLAAFIKQRRYELGITQLEISRAVGIGSPDYLSLVESGKRRLELDRMPALARVLKINEKELCQMALSEIYPEAADVIFGTQQATIPTEDLSNKGEQESFRRLLMLERNQRQPILDTIDALYDMRFRSRKGA